MTEIEDIRLGVLRFRKKVFPIREAHYRALANHQDPQVLFITCIDSRVDPAELCDADPGDMFVERTPGNLVPEFSKERVGVSASIEYAISALENVTDIVICGHSDCGALKAMLDPKKRKKFPAVDRWLTFADPALKAVNKAHRDAAPEEKLHRLCEQNIIAQIKNLHSHPCIQKRLKMRDKPLRIHGWVYGIDSGKVRRYDELTGTFALWPPENVETTPHPANRE